jgi:hypothetical protein
MNEMFSNLMIVLAFLLVVILIVATIRSASKKAMKQAAVAAAKEIHCVLNAEIAKAHGKVDAEIVKAHVKVDAALVMMVEQLKDGATITVTENHTHVPAKTHEPGSSASTDKLAVMCGIIEAALGNLDRERVKKLHIAWEDKGEYGEFVVVPTLQIELKDGSVQEVKDGSVQEVNFP